jgi:two-component system cell cycle response regulator
VSVYARAQVIVVAVVAVLALLSGVQHYVLKSDKYDELQQVFGQRLHHVYNHFEQEMVVHRYQYELRKLLLIPGVMEAIKGQERELLYDRLFKFWQILRQENPMLSIMHFHKANGETLLRMHNPGLYDDPIAKLRPLLQRMHRERAPLNGFEAGKHGMFMRVMLPIFEGSTYLGAVEAGLEMEYVTSGIQHLMGAEGFLFVDEEALSVLNIPYNPGRRIGNMVLWGDQSRICDCLKNLPPGFKFSHNTQIKNSSGELFLVHVFEQTVAEGSPRAVMLLLQNVAGYARDLRNSLVMNLAGIFVLALLVMVVLGLTTRKLLREVEIYSRQSDTDALTQIFNRKKFDELLEAEVVRSRRYSVPLSLIMFDLDHFKSVNDRYGHKVGDEVLVELCNLISSQIRVNDMFARWGGEEFMIILPAQMLAQAATIAEKLRKAVELHRFSRVGRMTISLGVVQFTGEELPIDLIDRVDGSLYQAKERGRNQTVAS